LESAVYHAIKKLLQKHVAKWKGVKSQEDGLGYVMNMIEGFCDDADSAYCYAYDEEG